MPPKNKDNYTARAMQLAGYLSAAYIALIFLLPANQAIMHHYNWTANEYRVLTLAIAAPSIIVWLVAFWGYSKLQTYAHAIKNTKEGPNFKRLSYGLAWLAWSLPLVTIATYFLNHSTNIWTLNENTSIIIENYITLLVPLIALVIISTAASAMVGNSRLSLNLASARLTMMVFLSIGVVFCFLVFRSLDLTSLNGSSNPYHLPVWLLIITIIIPYLYAWFVGLLAAYEITLFSAGIGGILYRKALLYLAYGLAIIIVSAIASQYIASVVPRSSGIVFNYRLYTLIFFRVLSAAGFILVTIGANRLRKIEEV